MNAAPQSAYMPVKMPFWDNTKVLGHCCPQIRFNSDIGIRGLSSHIRSPGALHVMSPANRGSEMTQKLEARASHIHTRGAEVEWKANAVAVLPHMAIADTCASEL